MTPFTRLAVLALVACAHAQYSDERAPRYIASEPNQAATTPVPILKQINRLENELFLNITTRQYPMRSSFFDHLNKVKHLLKEETLEPLWHNEDGSYTYGYEAADGSFKIETKSPAGEVKGKYGYKDDTGKVRVIEYGANKYGFQPAGEGITVAPPTLVDETKEERQRQENRQQPQSRRNQYQPAPAQAIDYDYNDEPAPQPAPRPAPRPQQQYRPQPPPQQQYRSEPSPPQQYRPSQPRQQFGVPTPTQRQQFGVPTPSQAPQYRPPQQSPTPPKPAFFPGAASVPAQDNNNHFFNPEPVPQRRTFQQKQQPAYRPQALQYPDFTDAAPSQQQFAQSVPQPPQRNQPYSMLDELLKEYGLPKSGAAPLHDISFGSY